MRTQTRKAVKFIMYIIANSKVLSVFSQGNLTRNSEQANRTVSVGKYTDTCTLGTDPIF